MSKVDKVSELLAETDSNIMNALRNSVYPGASDESIGMVLAYCKAKGYDPLAKAVHIVPMSVKNSKTGKNEWRDTIMPGIASYRINAERTGLHMGTSEAQYGPLITKKLGNKEFTYPEWCSVTVERFNEKSGKSAFFTAKVLWIESYTNKGKNKDTGMVNEYPNSMWEKRPHSQLEKCAEAAALRKAFSDMIGDATTFEEVEGKEIKNVNSLNQPSEEAFIDVLDEGHIKVLRELIADAGTTEEKMCAYLDIKDINDLTPVQWSKVCRNLDNRIQKQKKLAESPINQAFGTKEEHLAVDAKLVEEE